MPILLMTDEFNKYAVNVTVSGFTIVFIMLILLILIISLFGVIMSNTTGKKKAKKNKTAESKDAPQAPAASAAVEPAATDDDETIAVIAAAVEAFYAGSGKRAVVRSVKPSETFGRSAWSAAGIAQNTRAF